MEHKGTVKIETERLLLRAFTEQDSKPAFANWTNDSKVTEFLRWPAHRELAVTEKVLEDWIEHYRDPAFYQWAIVLKELGEPIGCISAVGMDEQVGMVHIGYCIGSRWWRKGYTSEALAAVISFFFREVKASRIESQHDPNNPNSGKVMEKCGMKKEGVLRKADWNNKGIVDACVYGILADEYEETIL